MKPQRVRDDDPIVDREEFVELGSVDAGELLAVHASTDQVTGLVRPRTVPVMNEVVRERRLDKVEIEVPVTHLVGDVPDELELVHWTQPYRYLGGRGRRVTRNLAVRKPNANPPI